MRQEIYIGSDIYAGYVLNDCDDINDFNCICSFKKKKENGKTKEDDYQRCDP